MELKFGDTLEEKAKNTSSNRTFMELKFLFISLRTACLLGSNRTFMELKSPYCKFLITSEGF